MIDNHPTPRRPRAPHTESYAGRAMAAIRSGRPFNLFGVAHVAMPGAAGWTRLAHLAPATDGTLVSRGHHQIRDFRLYDLIDGGQARLINP